MPAVCQTVPGADAFASNLLAFLDCEASTLGAGGYQSLSATGGTGAVLVGILLTLFVALWGYRLLLGERPTTRDIVLAVVKVGVVLTLASSWPAYQALIYDVVLQAPAQLASGIGAAQDLPGASGGLAARLDATETNFRQLEILGPGQSHTPEQQAARQATPPPLFPNFDTFALGSARLAFLGSALGSFALVRLAAGILLALAPVFAGFLFFDATRALFAGWLKGLIGVALAAVAISVVLGVELVLLEPWLQQLLAIRLADAPIPGIPGQLLAVSLVFAFALAGAMVILARIATSGPIPSFVSRFVTVHDGQARTPIARSEPANAAAAAASFGEERARALVVADAIAATQRREADTASLTRAAGYMAATSRSTAVASGDSQRQVALGQSFRRRAGTRVSARARERDNRS